MKVIVAGSRGYSHEDEDNYEAIRDAFVHSGLWQRYGKQIEIVSGLAKGPDTLGVMFAERNKLKLYKFKPDWDGLGKRAGIVRNIAMGDFSDALIALWDGESKGTKQMIDYAIDKGLFVYYYDANMEGWVTWNELQILFQGE